MGNTITGGTAVTPSGLLAGEADLIAFGYETSIAASLPKADARVRGYLKRRMSAQAVLEAGATIPADLAEVVCSIAARMSATNPNVASGVRSETTGALSVTYGAEAYAGLSHLTGPEKAALDALYPAGIRTVEL